MVKNIAVMGGFVALGGFLWIPGSKWGDIIHTLSLTEGPLTIPNLISVEDME